MSTKPCPACGAATAGRFCSQCGASVEAPVKCAECGNELPAGGRYCNACGAPTPATAAALAAAPPPRSQPVVPWVIAGAAVTALVAALVLRGGGEETPAPEAPFANGAAAGDPSAVDLSSMTPRQAADRLYERVMTSAEAGDSAQARQFLPMALQAYSMVPPQEVDADARYHLGVLHLFNGDAASARAQADTILSAAPTHLFGLYNAAQAERASGNVEAARGLYERFLAAYDAEVAKSLPEYQAHQPVLDVMRQDASRVVDTL